MLVLFMQRLFIDALRNIQSAYFMHSLHNRDAWRDAVEVLLDVPCPYMRTGKRVLLMMIIILHDIPRILGAY